VPRSNSDEGSGIGSQRHLNIPKQRKHFFIIFLATFLGGFPFPKASAIIVPNYRE
jgi:hypothetical protein